jgi:hypothetical protein
MVDYRRRPAPPAWIFSVIAASRSHPAGRVQEVEDLLLLGSGFSRPASWAASRPARELQGHRSAAIACARISANLEQRTDGGCATIAHSAVQWRRPVPVSRVWIGAQFDEAEDGLPLGGGIPARRARDAVNRVVKRLRVPAVHS